MRKKRINKGVFALPIVKNHANPTRFLPQRKAKNTRIRAYVVFLREKIPGPPFSGKPQSQRNVCQGNGKSVCTASVTEGEKVGRAVLCPPRRARSARPTSQGRRITRVFRIIPLTDIPLTPLRFLPSSIFALVAAGRAGLLALFRGYFIATYPVDSSISQRRQAFPQFHVLKSGLDGVDGLSALRAVGDALVADIGEWVQRGRGTPHARARALPKGVLQAVTISQISHHPNWDTHPNCV